MRKTTRQTYAFFWHHSKRHRGLMLIITLGVSLAVVVQIIVPLYYKKFFDILAQNSNNINPSLSELYKIIFYILLLNLASWILHQSATLTNNYFQPKVMAEILDTCFIYLHNHSFGFFVNKMAGGLVRKVNRLVSAFEVLSDRILGDLFPMLVRLTAVFIVLAYRQTVLAYILLGWSLAYVTLNYFLTLKKLKYDEVRTATDTKVNAHLTDTITNSRAVKIFTALSFERNEFLHLIKRQFAARVAGWNLDAYMEAAQVAFTVALEFLVFFYAIRFWQQGILTVGDFVLIQAYLLQVFYRLWDFGRLVRRLYQSLAEAREMIEILNDPYNIRDKPNARHLDVQAGSVGFNNVRFAYNPRREVIKGFHLTVQAGERVGLVGPSGSGKTTLISLLLRFYDVDQGAIYIDGQNIVDVTQDSLRRSIAFVPQDAMLFHRTILENIRYGRLEASDEEVLAAARAAYCEEFIERLPDKYNTMVGERGIKLSGGERQRITIARAFLKRAHILAMDEATSSLDSHTEVIIHDALHHLLEGKTALIIAHRLSTIMEMDRIVVMKDGRIQEIGDHDELVQKRGGLYKQLWDLQAGGFLV